ncbi:MAG: hypothetical protein AB7N80_12520 [Bdellovibrionales bacterium]
MGRSLVLLSVFLSCPFVFADRLAEFTLNRDINVTILGPVLVGNKDDYTVISERGRTILAKKDYRLEQIHAPYGWTVSEVMRIQNQGPVSQGFARLATLDRESNVQSYTQCGATDVDAVGLKKIGLDRKSADLFSCATVTPAICAEVAKIGALSAEDFDAKVSVCQDLDQAKKNLFDLTRQSLYSQLRNKHLQDLSNSYSKMLRPESSLRNKVLDSSKATPGTIHSAIDFDAEKAKEQGQFLGFMFRACDHLKILAKPKTRVDGDKSTITQ